MLLTLTDKLWATDLRNATEADYNRCSPTYFRFCCARSAAVHTVFQVSQVSASRKGFCCGAGKPRPNSDGRLFCRCTSSLSRGRRLLLCLHQRSLSLGRLECQLHHLRAEVLSIVL